jgi:hypothetical protein
VGGPVRFLTTVRENRFGRDIVLARKRVLLRRWLRRRGFKSCLHMSLEDMLSLVTLLRKER